MAKDEREPSEIDRDAEEARQDFVVASVAARNAEIAAGADPDPNVGTGFYPGEEA